MKTWKKGLSGLLALLMLVMAVPFGGLTAFASAIDAGMLYLDTPATAVIENGGDIVSFDFTPTESGAYMFCSSAAADTYGYIYDTEGNCLQSDDDGGGNRNFKVVCDLTAGVTYKLQARYYYYDVTGSFEVCVSKYVPKLIDSIVFHDYTRFVWDSYTDTFYDEETGETIEWQRYDYGIHHTVTYTDGTSEERYDSYLYDDEGWYHIECSDDQSYSSPWGAGEHTVSVSVPDLGITGSFTVEIVESPVASVTVEPITKLEKYDGYYKTSEIWDEETEQWIETPEYFYYHSIQPDWDDVVITLKDGTVIEGSEFEWNGDRYSINYSYYQNYENRLQLGVNEIPASIAGYEFTYEVEIIESPVASVTVEPIVKIENDDGYYNRDGYWDENDDYVETPEYFYYNDLYPNWETTVITLKDGTVIENNGFEWNGGWYSINTYGTNQSYENQWTVGNTYEIEAKIAGYEFTYTVEIVESPVASVTVEPIRIVENTNGHYTSGYWDENDNYVETPEYFYYDDLYPNWETTVITLKDGTVFEGTEFEWNGEWYSIGIDYSQNYENQWTVGNTYEIEAEIAGYEFTYEVEIVETPVDYVEIEPIVYYEGTNGEMERDEYWDVEKQEWVYSPEYYRYYFYSSQFTIYLKDGSVHEYGNFEWNGRNYWVSDLENDDDQSYENPWTAGNTYTQTRTIAGYQFDFEVEIAETPVASITVKPLEQLQYTNGYYTYDSYWDEESEQPVQTPEYFRYYTPYPGEDDVVITLKDGTVINNYGFYLDGEWVGISVYGVEQSYDNQWMPGTTKTVRASLLGYDFTYEATVIETPIASVTVEPIRIVENTDGYYRTDGYWDEDDNYVETPEYFRYHTPYPYNAVITLKDGTVIEGTGFEWNGGWYSISTYGTNQSYENQWTAGNTYELKGSILGYEFTYEVEIIQLSANDSFEYMESEDGIIITDSFIAPETLEIPAEIDGKPVIGVAGLGGYNGVKHLIFPDSVQTIGDYVIDGFNSLETVTFGSSIRNLRSYMFAYSYNLSDIAVAEDNAYFCTVDGVLYNKAMTKVIAYPIQKGDTYEVPKTVTDISALDYSIYSGLEIVFPADHPYFVTVDGVTYNKDMTKVLFCSKDKAGSYTMPDTVTEIAASAFQGCNQLTEVIISSQVTEIVYCVFSSCASLEKVELPSGLISIDERAFEYTEALESIELPEGLEYIGSLAFQHSGLTSLSVPDSVMSIGSSAFYSTNIATLDLGNGVKEIYNNAFAYTPVTAVVLPDSLEWLGSSAFEGCSKLKTLSIGSGLSEISNWTFADTGLESVDIPGTVKHIGNYAFAYSAIGELTLNEGLEAIGNDAFFGCCNLTEAAIPASVVYLSWRIFGDCDSLEKLTVAEGNETYHSNGNCIILTNEKTLIAGCGGSVIPTDGSVTAIDVDAFFDSDNLEAITIPDTVSYIGYMAFYDCDSITEIVIPDSVTILDGATFYHCDSLTTVVIGDGIEVIGEQVFAYCPLTSVDLGSSLPYIPEWAFTSTNLTEVFIPNSVTDIMYGAFCKCSDLTSIELPLSVQSIDHNAFGWCENLTDVYYEGTEEDRENIYIGENNEYLLNATWHYGWTNEKWDGETGGTDTPVVPDVPDECEHVYDNACDVDCNKCGEFRKPANHVYDNACDVDCNECGEFRKPADHVYDNACDADCNVCGDTRVPADHVYDDEYDADCNECGDIRDVPERPVEPDVPVVPPVTDGPLFIVDSATAKAGDTFTVALRTEGNTGIVSLKVDVGYDADLLELVSIVGQDFVGTSFGPLTNNPIAVNWLNTISSNNTTNGTVALLTFRVKDTAPVGSTAITISYNADDVYDFDFNNVTFGTENGTVEIIDYIPGDVNGDGNVNNKDLGQLQRYINGWSVEINENAGDVNGDDNINNKDLGVLQRYINGWNVELK